MRSDRASLRATLPPKVARHNASRSARLDTSFIGHQDCLLHDMGAQHPECPARLAAIEDQLIASGLINYLQRVDAPKAEREHLERVHDPGYIDAIIAKSPTQGI